MSAANGIGHTLSTDNSTGQHVSWTFWPASATNINNVEAVRWWPSPAEGRVSCTRVLQRPGVWGRRIRGRLWWTCFVWAWLATEHIVFDWRSLHNIKANATSAPLSDGARRRLDALRSHYAAVFGSDRGHLQPSRGHLTLRDGAQPKFLKARPLPYALRDRVGLEHDRLEQDGILTKVSHSDWATPVVPIPKKDGSVRICGDFKVTVNPQLKVDQYPLPRIDDIFASLGGGKHFSKIDLRSAYLQMKMDDESKTLLTLNTHKGLYRLNRLAFGIASAPAMWQRVMDQLLLQLSLRTRLDLIRPSTRSVVQQQQCAQAGNTLFQPARDLPVGATAMVSDYRPDHPRWISGRVSAKGLHYQVEVHPDTHWRRHIDQICPTAANPETPPVLTAENPETPLVLTALSQPSTPDTAEYSPEESTESQSEQELCSESAVEECVTERRYPLRDRKPVVRMNLWQSCLLPLLALYIMIFFLSIPANIHLQIRREEWSVFYSTFALVLVPGLVSLLRTHAQLMLSSILLSFSPSLRFSHLATASAIPASCVSVCVPRTNTIFAFNSSV